MSNFKVELAYNGTRFHGFQVQKEGVRTVSSEIVQAIEKILHQKVGISFAGRTDAGVHAEGQVVNFKTDAAISPSSLKKALNSVLPSDIRVRDVTTVPESFHARRSAIRREYRYWFCTREQELPMYLGEFVSKVEFRLSFEHMERFRDVFLGTHDFKYFKCEGTPVKSTKKTIYDFSFSQLNQLYEIRVAADGFLYKMMRNIVGAVVRVLMETQTLEDLRDMLECKSRYLYTTAQPQGLCLEKVYYE